MSVMCFLRSLVGPHRGRLPARADARAVVGAARCGPGGRTPRTGPGSGQGPTRSAGTRADRAARRPLPSTRTRPVPPPGSGCGRPASGRRPAIGCLRPAVCGEPIQQLLDDPLGVCLRIGQHLLQERLQVPGALGAAHSQPSASSSAFCRSISVTYRDRPGASSSSSRIAERVRLDVRTAVEAELVGVGGGLVEDRAEHLGHVGHRYRAHRRTAARAEGQRAPDAWPTSGLSIATRP